MPLKATTELMQDAREAGYAIGYFESWDLASLQGVVDAAEETRSPVVVGFNGDFLSRPGRLAEERLEWYASLGKAAAESASVPCGLIFNECGQDDWTRQAAGLGFTMIAVSDPEAAYGDYVRRVASLAECAHERGVAIEAEIGELPCGASGEIDTRGTSTDPEQAQRFVEATGVDLLAVSVGNVHVLVRGEKGLDLDRLEEIHRRIPTPLVLHGGTGIAADALRAAVSRGVAKVNYGTCLKQRYLAALRKRLDDPETNPHHLLGYGGEEDAMVAARLAVRDAVLERMGALGCCGKV